MVAVALHPFGHVALPQCLPFHTTSGILCEPFVIQFIHYKNTIAVAESHKVLAIWIVGCADMVVAERLHQLYALLDGTGIGSCAKGTEGVVVGITLEQHFLAVEPEAEGGRELDGAHSKLLAYLVNGVAFFVVEGHLGSI